jgi:hypothetical protein
LQSGCNSRFVAKAAAANHLRLLRRMGGRVVEGTGLENRQTRKRLEGSNPSPSANTLSSTVQQRPTTCCKTIIFSVMLSSLDGLGLLLSTPEMWIRVWLKASDQEHQQVVRPQNWEPENSPLLCRRRGAFTCKSVLLALRVGCSDSRLIVAVALYGAWFSYYNEPANECRKLRLLGIDPIEQRKQERQRARLESAQAMTFDQCRDAYIAAHAPSWKNRTVPRSRSSCPIRGRSKLASKASCHLTRSPMPMSCS